MVQQDKYIAMLLDRLEEDGYAVAAELENTLEEEEHSEIVDIRTIASLYRAEHGHEPGAAPAPDDGLDFDSGDVPHSALLLAPVQPQSRGSDWRAITAAAATCTILILSGILAGILV